MKFLNFGCCEMGSEATLGPKTSLLIFAKSWHGNKILIHFTPAHMEIEVSISGFKPPGNDVKGKPMQAG